MDRDGHLAALATEAERFASVIEESDPLARVPACPDWTVRELCHHTGGLHRWSTRLVAEQIVTEIYRPEMDIEYPSAEADSAELAAWVRSGIDPMMSAFSGDPLAPVWAWGPDQHARFWPRRMLFETVIHLVDLQQAGAFRTDVDAVTAVEGVDEILELLPSTARWRREPDPRVLILGTIVFAASDMDTTWRVRCRKTGMFWDRGSDRADVTVVGTAADILIALYRRSMPDEGGLTTEGDSSLANAWLERVGF